ncbi:MAG: DinB family protein [Anaerolineales bacterium]|nr:DinB family protein [Anaerolineales bacterium]
MSGAQALIRKRLADEGAKSAAFFRGLTPEQFAQQVYTTGPQWRVRDVLAHFVSAERTFIYYGRDILQGGGGAPDDFVIDEFNLTQMAEYLEANTDQLIAQFEAARADTLAFVDRLSDADLQRVGRHPWFGRVPIEYMSKLIYRHNMLHERDVRRALEARQPVPHVDAQPQA